MSLDFKKYFSIFKNYQNDFGGDLIYFDNSSSSLTPDIVVNKMNEYYTHYKSNVDRAISKISIVANQEYENSRKILAKFLNVNEDEIIWTSGASMSSNLLWKLIEENNFLNLNQEDEILTTIFEHHSSFLPIQEFTKKKNLKLQILNLDEKYNFDFQDLKNKLNSKTKIISISLASNVLGNLNNLKEIVKEIRNFNKEIFIISDLTAAYSHININLKELDIDAGFLSFHKGFGPTGVGILFLKREISRNFKPIFFGGGMISNVSLEKTDYRSDIKLFEVGTQNIAGIIGVGESIKFLEEIFNFDLKNNFLHTQELLKYFLNKVENFNQEEEKKEADILKIQIFTGNIENNLGIISFQIFLDKKEIHPHDVADILSKYNISIRAGHHCAEPLMNYFNLKNGLNRISFQIYNSKEEINFLMQILEKVGEIFKNKKV